MYCMECRKYVGINFNMGCIETQVVCTSPVITFGLTLTWDVLKLINGGNCYSFGRRLTLTWDVLKPRPEAEAKLKELD